MEVRVQTIHFDASEQLQAFIQKKVGKLEKFYEDVKKVEVSLKVVKPETVANKEVSMELSVPGTDLFVSKIADTFEEAVDQCAEVLGKQLVKHKEKQRNNG